MSNKLRRIGIVSAIICIIIAIVGYVIVRTTAPEGEKVLLSLLGKVALIIISVNLITLAISFYALKRNKP